MNHFEKVREILFEKELDAILITGEYNRFYASGFHSTGGDGMALVTKESNIYMTDSRYIEAAQNKIPDAEVLLTDQENPYTKLINEQIERFGIKKLGFEDETMTVSEFKKYSEKIKAEFIAVSRAFYAKRQVKDREELDCIVKAQRIAEKALEDLLKDGLEGMTEKQVAAKLEYLMRLNGGEGISFDTIVASGPNGSMPHAVPTDRVIENGDYVTMDFGSLYNSYHSDMTRTVAVGQVSDEMKKVYDIVLKAQMAGIEVAKAGATGREVHMAGAKVIEDAGYGKYFGHGFGHGVGIEIHEEPFENPRNEAGMPAGAVVTAEPGIYIPGKFGIRTEDMLFLTADGNENLTKAPK